MSNLYPIGTRVRLVHPTTYPFMKGAEGIITPYPPERVGYDCMVDWHDYRHLSTTWLWDTRYSQIEPIIEEKDKAHNQVREWDDCAWKPNRERVL